MSDPRAFYDALNAAGIEYAGFSCNGVNLFGDSESVKALKQWHHQAGTVPQLKNEIIRLRAELRDHQYSGGNDWAQMAADVDYGRGR